MSSYSDARMAVYAEAVSILDASKTLQPSSRASILRDVALAVRYAGGGPQPGSAHVEK